MKTRAGTFLLIIAGIILAFFLAEFLVRVFLPQDKVVTWIEMHPRGFMMNQRDTEAIHHFNDRELRYHFNELGLRGEESIRKDATNILLLGDSFTFGLLLHRKDTFASLLQKNLSHSFPSRNIQVLNGGVGGAGLADWPAWLEHNGKAVSPDIVILYLNYLDVDRALSKNLYVADENNPVLVDSKRWEMKNTFRSLGRTGWYRWLQKHSEVMNILVKLAWGYLYFSDLTHGFDQDSSPVPVPSKEDFDPESGYSLRLARLLTERVSNWCMQNNCKFILTTTGFFDKNQTGIHTYAYYKMLTGEPSATDFFFDNTPCVNEEINGNFNSIQIPGDTHPDKRGAEIIAECSMNWLQPLLEQHASSP